MYESRHRQPDDLPSCTHCKRTLSRHDQGKEIELFSYSRYGVAVKHIGVICTQCCGTAYPQLAKA